MTERRKLIAGNWKMNRDREGSRALAREIAAGLPAGFPADVVLFPSAPFIADVVETVTGSTHPIGVGAQNLHFEETGAFTGEISAAMITSTGARWVLVGHSERRHVFGEPDDIMGAKVKAALRAGLSPVLCVGETIEERRAGGTEEVVLRQLRAGLNGIDGARIDRVVIAYEPVWAIGTGETATPEQGEQVHRSVRAELARLGDAAVVENTRILYGGSVTPDNVAALLSEPDIDGALVGGASLDSRRFLAICRWQSGA